MIRSSYFDLLNKIVVEVALIISIDHPAVAINRRSDIIGITHTAFDLKALNTALYKSFKIFGNIPVFGRQEDVLL